MTALKKQKALALGVVSYPCPLPDCDSHRQARRCGLHVNRRMSPERASVSDCGCYPRVKAGLVKRFKDGEVVRQDQRWQCQICRTKYLEVSPERQKQLQRKSEATVKYAFEWQSIRQVAQALKISKSQAHRLIQEDFSRNASSEEEMEIRKIGKSIGADLPQPFPTRLIVQLRLHRLFLKGIEVKQFIERYQKYQSEWGSLWRQGIRPRIVVESRARGNQRREFLIVPEPITS